MKQVEKEAERHWVSVKRDYESLGFEVLTDLFRYSEDEDFKQRKFSRFI
jgi:hypothetical protein